MLGRDDEVACKSFRNLPDVQLILADELNAYDVLCNDWIVFTRATLPGGPTRHRPSSWSTAGRGRRHPETPAEAR